MVGAPCRPPAHGLAVAAGIVVGSYLGPYRLVGEGNLRIPPNWRVVLLLGIGCVLLCQWLVACAGTWYALRPSTSLPSPLRWIGLPVAAVVAGGLVALFVRGTLSDRSLALAASAAVVLVLLGFLRSAALTGIVSVPAFPAMVTCLFVFGGIPFTTPPGPPYCAPAAPPVTMVVVMCDALRPNCRPGSFTELDRARVRAAVEDLVGAHVIVVAPSSGISSLAIGNGPLATTVERGLYEDLRQRVNQIPGVADVSMVDAASAAIPRRESC
jgi:hypothetical protein